jgi:hypothetical protein
MHDTSAANPPAGKSPERAVWTPTELRTFIEHVRSDRLFAVWMLFATTGMRRSEVAGLPAVDARCGLAVVREARGSRGSTRPDRRAPRCGPMSAA